MKADCEKILKDSCFLNNHEISEKYGVSLRRVQQILSESGVKNKNRKKHILKSDLSEQGFVYEIDVNGYKYIGQTINLNRRMLVHINDLKAGKHSCTFLQSFFNENPEPVLKAFLNPKILKSFKNIKISDLLNEEKKQIIKKAAKGDLVVNEILGEIILYKLKEEK